MCYELRVLTALTQLALGTLRLPARPDVQLSITAHMSSDLASNTSGLFVPRPRSIDFQINQELIDSESELICSIVCKSAAVFQSKHALYATGVCPHAKQISLPALITQIKMANFLCLLSRCSSTFSKLCCRWCCEFERFCRNEKRKS